MGIMGGPDPTAAEMEALRREHTAREDQERQRLEDKQARTEITSRASANQGREANRPVQEGAMPERTDDKPDLRATEHLTVGAKSPSSSNKRGGQLAMGTEFWTCRSPLKLTGFMITYLGLLVTGLVAVWI